MHIRQKVSASERLASKRRKGTKFRYSWINSVFASDRARFVAFGCFVLLVALTGGSSRSDVPSLIILRPAAVLFSAYALLFVTREQLRLVRAPLLVVAALMLVALLQLAPLPATIWPNLPDRDAAAKASVLAGIGNAARPFSLDPNRTWNAFFSLFVPLATIGLVAVQTADWRRRIVVMLLAAGLLSAALGFVQAIGGNDLQLYDVAHQNYPTGLFANKNHQSIMLLWLMLATSWIAATADVRQVSPNAAVGGALASILVLFPLLVLTGSRAGLLLSVPALTLCAWLLFRAPATRALFKRAGARAKMVQGLIAATVVTPLAVIFAVLAMSERQSAFSRLFEVEAGADLRWQYFPVMERMALDFMPLGSGFGSFETVFNMYEPATTLTTRYMNQAHNDLLQLVIEGGLPVLIVLAATLFWFGRMLWHLWWSERRGSKASTLFYGGSIGVWLGASLVDYPLRAPLATMLVAALTAQLCFPSSDRRSGSGTSANAAM